MASPGTHPSPYVQSGYLIHKHQTYTICFVVLRITNSFSGREADEQVNQGN